jgi:hypothetical protein
MPHVDALDTFLNHKILTSNPRHWWAVKVRAKAVLAQSPHPDALARRILNLLAAPDVMRQAA